MKKAFLACFLALSLSTTVSASSPLDWYESQKQSNETQETETHEIKTQKTDTQKSGKQETEPPETETSKAGKIANKNKTADETNALKIHMIEESIISPMFGCSVGRTMIPEGWTISVQDLGLGSESASCPNAVFMTATSPDGSASMSFLSRREYCQKYNNVSGFEYSTGDDEYDYTTLTHNLNYRNADACCDLMQNILYGDASFTKNRGLTGEEAELIPETNAEYYNMISGSLSAYPNIGQLVDTEFTAARRSYSDGQEDYTLFCSSCGYEVQTNSYAIQSDIIMWAMPFVYALKTDSANHEAYQEAFDVFCSSTAVSDEYEDMREQNAMQIFAEMAKTQSGGSYTPDSTDYTDYINSFDYSTNADSTIESGDTYTALDGWDDVIKEQSDYTTGSGEHVKVPTYFDHVYEGSDGSIYATNSFDVPYDSTELFPTQIGE